MKGIKAGAYIGSNGLFDSATVNAYRASIKGLSATQAEAALSASGLNAAQRQQILTSKESTVANAGQATSFNVLTRAVWANVKAMAKWLVTTPTGWITLAIGATVGLITAYNNVEKKQNELIENARNLQEEYRSFAKDTAGKITSLEGQAEEFNKLAKGVDKYGNNISLASDEYDRYKSIVAEILGYSPELIQGYDAEGNAIADKNRLLERSIELLKEEQRLKLKKMTTDEKTGEAYDAAEAGWQQVQGYEGANTRNQIARWFDDNALRGGANYEVDIAKVLGIKDEWKEEGNNLQNAIINNIDTVVKNIKDKKAELLAISDGDGNAIFSVDEIDNMIDLSNDWLYAYNQWQQDIEDAKHGMDDQFDLYAQRAKSYNDLTDAQKVFVNEYIRATGDITDAEGHLLSEDKILEKAKGYEKFVNEFAELNKLGEGGSVDLTFRPEIDTEELNKKGWEAGEGFATVFSSAISNTDFDDLIPENAEDTVAINFTPIIVDPNTGEFKGVLSEEELYAYAHDVLAGVREDDLNLQIGAKFEGKNAIDEAVTDGERIHYLHEKLFINNDTVDSWEELRKVLVKTGDDAVQAGENTNRMTDSLENLNKELDAIQSAYQAVESAIEEFNDTGSLSVDTYQALTELEAKYIPYLIDEQGNLTLTKDALNELTAARIREAAVKQAEDYIDYIANLGSEEAQIKALTGVINEETSALNQLILAKLQAKVTDGTISIEVARQMVGQLNGIIGMAESAIAGLNNGGLGKNVKDTAKEIAEAKEDYAQKVADINEDLVEKEQQFAEDMAEAWKEEHLEQLKDNLAKREEILNQYKEDIDITDFGLDSVNEDDYLNKSDLLSAKLEQLINYGVAMREEFERISNIIPQTGDEAQELADRLTTLGKDMRDNISTIRETKVAIQTLRLDAFNSIAEDSIDKIQSELDNIDRRIEILNADNRDDFKYTRKFLNMQSLLPTHSSFEKTRKDKQRQDAELINQERITQNTINEVVAKALEMQSKENAKAREKERQNLIKDMEKARRDAQKKLEDARKDHEKKMAEIQNQTANTMYNIKNIINSTDFELNPVDFTKFLESIKTATDEGKALIDEFDEYKNNAMSSSHNLKDGDRLGGTELQIARESGFFDNSNIKYNPSAGVEQWRDVATKALKITGQYSPENVDLLLFQMQTESSGNPKAINDWDINAINGTPSKGLMQVIDPTFKTYALKGYDSDIYDPLSNIIAAIRYTVSRYGSLKKGWRGVGYAKGTPFHPGGLAMVGDENWLKGWNKPAPELAIYPDGTSEILGENGVEIRDLPKGTSVIPAKPTKDILETIPNYANGTSKLLEMMAEAAKSAEDDALLASSRAQMNGEIASSDVNRYINNYLESKTWTFKLDDNDPFVVKGITALQNITNFLTGLSKFDKSELVSKDDYFRLLEHLPKETTYTSLIRQQQKLEEEASKTGSYVDASAIEDYLFEEFFKDTSLYEDFDALKNIGNSISSMGGNLNAQVMEYYQSLINQGVDIQRTFEDATMEFNSLLESELLNPEKDVKQIFADVMNPDTDLGSAFARFTNSQIEKEQVKDSLIAEWANKNDVLTSLIEENQGEFLNSDSIHTAFIIGGEEFAKSFKKYLENPDNTSILKEKNFQISAWNKAVEKYANINNGNLESIPFLFDQKSLNTFLETYYRLAELNGEEIPEYGGYQRIVKFENGNSIPWDKWSVKTIHPAAIAGIGFEPIEGYEGQYGLKGNNTFITKDGQIIQRGAFTTTFYDKNDPSSVKTLLNSEADELIPESIKDLIKAVPTIDDLITEYKESKNQSIYGTGTGSSYIAKEPEPINPEIEGIEDILSRYNSAIDDILIKSRVEQGEIDKFNLSDDEKERELFKLSELINEEATSTMYDYAQELNKEYLDYIAQTKENPDLFDPEVIKRYEEAIAEIGNRIYEFEADMAKRRDDLISKLTDGLDLYISKLGSAKTLLQSHFDIENAIIDAQHELNKDLEASLISYQYLDEEARKLLFNQEDYNALNETLLDIQDESLLIQSRYRKAIDKATSEELNEITQEYQMQYETLMKSYEIAKADLEIAKKKQKLNNVLNERKVKMFINGSWQWVANIQDVIEAQGEYADAKYNYEKAESGLEQTEAIQQITKAENAFNTAINKINDGAYELEDILSDLNLSLDDVYTSGIPALRSTMREAETIFAEFVNGITGSSITANTNKSGHYDLKVKRLIDADGMKVDGYYDENNKLLNVVKHANGTKRTKSGSALMGEEGFEAYITDKGHLIPIVQPTLFDNVGAGGIVFNQAQLNGVSKLWDMSNKLSSGYNNLINRNNSQTIDNSVVHNVYLNGVKINDDIINIDALKRYLGNH